MGEASEKALARRLLLLATLALYASPVFAHPGIGIVVDNHGNVFYTDLRQVWRMSPDGKREMAVPNVHTHELHIDSEGNLFGEHLWYEGDRTGKWGHYVWKRSPDGRLEKVISPTEGFLANYSFVRDRQGNMYWADRGETVTRIRRRSVQAGGEIRTIAESPFRNVRWMAVSAEGVVYLIDYQDLVRIRPRGKPEVMARGLARNSRWMLMPNEHAVMGLSPDAEGNVYVAVMADHEVKKVTPEGVVSTVSKSTAPWAPTGVLAVPYGVLWILEGGSPLGVRARRITAAAVQTPAAAGKRGR
jgi:sugar lactone lactonase YvrE